MEHEAYKISIEKMEKLLQESVDLTNARLDEISSSVERYKLENNSRMDAFAKVVEGLKDGFTSLAQAHKNIEDIQKNVTEMVMKVEKLICIEKTSDEIFKEGPPANILQIEKKTEREFFEEWIETYPIVTLKSGTIITLTKVFNDKKMAELNAYIEKLNLGITDALYKAVMELELSKLAKCKADFIAAYAAL